MGILGEKLWIWLWEVGLLKAQSGPVDGASRRCAGLYEAVPFHHPAAGDQLCLWGSISALSHPSAFGVKCLTVHGKGEAGISHCVPGSQLQGSVLCCL